MRLLTFLSILLQTLRLECRPGKIKVYGWYWDQYPKWSVEPRSMGSSGRAARRNGSPICPLVKNGHGRSKTFRLPFLP